MLLCHSATPHKGFIWICATDHIQLGCDTIPELQFSPELFVFQLSELSMWHKWPSGREQQEVGMEQCDLLWKPPLTEGNSRGAECASKDILVLISQVTVIN